MSREAGDGRAPDEAPVSIAELERNLGEPEPEGADEEENAHGEAEDRADEGAEDAGGAEASAAEATPKTVSLAAALGEDTLQPGDELPPWLEGAIEAIAFVSTEPVTVARVREQLAGDGEQLDATMIRRAFKQLARKWQEEDRSVARGITLVEVGGGIAFRTSAEQGRFLRRMFVAKPQRLSRASLETLAIVAYRQPLTRPQIDDIRGVDSSGAVKALLDKRLLRVLGKADDVGRPLLYGTTKTFLEFFGLASLRDLPTLKEYHELKGEGLVPEVGEDEEGEEGAPPTASIVMDLFHPEKVGTLVSGDTQHESDEALDALEQALGQAAAVAKRTSDPHAPIPDDFMAEASAEPADQTHAETEEPPPPQPSADAHPYQDAPDSLEETPRTSDSDPQGEEREDDPDGVPDRNPSVPESAESDKNVGAEPHEDPERLAELDLELAALGVDPDLSDDAPFDEGSDDAEIDEKNLESADESDRNE